MGIINVQNSSKIHANKKGKSTCVRMSYNPHISQSNITAAEVHYVQEQTRI